MWEQEILKMVFEMLFPWPIIVFLIIGVWLYSTFRKASEGKVKGREKREWKGFSNSKGSVSSYDILDPSNPENPWRYID